MNSRQKRTLAAIFQHPTRSDVAWADVESLLTALGAELREGNGSRVRVVLSGIIHTFHRPHPSRVTNRPTLRDVADMIAQAGFAPDADPTPKAEEQR